MTRKTMHTYKNIHMKSSVLKQSYFRGGLLRGRTFKTSICRHCDYFLHVTLLQPKRGVFLGGFVFDCLKEQLRDISRNVLN